MEFHENDVEINFKESVEVEYFCLTCTFKIAIDICLSFKIIIVQMIMK